MDEISKINIFGHQAISKMNDELSKKQSQKPQDKEEVKEQGFKNTQLSGDEVLNAMNLKGLMNKAQMGVNSINPRDYLSEERIKDIEDSMLIFDKGVEEHAEMIREEFGKMPNPPLSEAGIYELAARAFTLKV